MAIVQLPLTYYVLQIHGLFPKDPMSHTSINTRAEYLLFPWQKPVLAFNCMEV